MICIDLYLPGAKGCLATLEPDVVIFEQLHANDLAEPDLLGPGVPWIELDAEQGALTISNGRHSVEQGIGDLVSILKEIIS